MANLKTYTSFPRLLKRLRKRLPCRAPIPPSAYISTDNFCRSILRKHKQRRLAFLQFLLDCDLDSLHLQHMLFTFYGVVPNTLDPRHNKSNTSNLLLLQMFCGKSTKQQPSSKSAIRTLKVAGVIFESLRTVFGKEMNFLFSDMQSGCPNPSASGQTMIRYRDLISIGVKEGFYEDEGDTDTDTDTNTDTDSSDSSYRPSDSDGSTSSGSCEEFEVRAERRVINLLFRLQLIAYKPRLVIFSSTKAKRAYLDDFTATTLHSIDFQLDLAIFNQTPTILLPHLIFISVFCPQELRKSICFICANHLYDAFGHLKKSATAVEVYLALTKSVYAASSSRDYADLEKVGHERLLSSLQESTKSFVAKAARSINDLGHIIVPKAKKRRGRKISRIGPILDVPIPPSWSEGREEVEPLKRVTSLPSCSISLPSKQQGVREADTRPKRLTSAKSLPAMPKLKSEPKSEASAAPPRLVRRKVESLEDIDFQRLQEYQPELWDYWTKQFDGNRMAARSIDKPGITKRVMQRRISREVARGFSKEDVRIEQEKYKKQPRLKGSGKFVETD